MNCSKFTSEIKSINELTEIEIDRWDEIQSQSCFLQKAFYSYPFCRAVATYHPFVRICLIKKNQNIVAILPFQFKDSLHARLKIAERVGGEMSDYFGIIALSDFVISMDDLVVLTGLNLLHFTHLDEAQASYGFVEESPEKGLLINIGDSSDIYFKVLKESNKKLVGDTSRRQRKIEKDIGKLNFCFNVQPDVRKGVLTDLIHQKKNQYSRTNVPDCLNENWKRQALFELLSTDGRLCKGVLSTLYAGDVWIASHFGLQCNNTLHFWFPVYNSEMAKYSPGRLLMNHVIAAATLQSPQIALVDRGTGVTKAKTDFANSDHTYYRGEIFQPGIVTFSYKAFRSLKWKMQKVLDK